jgi:hypothetical protein
MRPFAITTCQGQRDWAAVIKVMEDALVLHKHKPGSLTRQWRYLHDRSGGSICGLSDLIRESAVEAILSGAEAVTRSLMDTIKISELAQQTYLRHQTETWRVERTQLPLNALLGCP